MGHLYHGYVGSPALQRPKTLNYAIKTLISYSPPRAWGLHGLHADALMGKYTLYLHGNMLTYWEHIYYNKRIYEYMCFQFFLVYLKQKYTVCYNDIIHGMLEFECGWKSWTQQHSLLPKFAIICCLCVSRFSRIIHGPRALFFLTISNYVFRSCGHHIQCFGATLSSILIMHLNQNIWNITFGNDWNPIPTWWF